MEKKFEYQSKNYELAWTQNAMQLQKRKDNNRTGKMGISTLPTIIDYLSLLFYAPDRFNKTNVE